MLGKLIGQARHLQNNPKLGVIPEEERAAKVVREYLEANTPKDSLKILEFTYVEKRPNLKITLTKNDGEGDGWIFIYFLLRD